MHPLMNNAILKALSQKDHRLLSRQLQLVALPKGLTLYEPGEVPAYIYLPRDCMISYLSGTEDGETIEIAVVGNEGLVGVVALLSDAATFRAIVQIGGSA